MARGIFILAIMTLFVLSVKSDDLNFLEEVDCTARSFTLRPEKWPKRYVTVGFDAKGQLYGSKGFSIKHHAYFFERINANEPYFHIIFKERNDVYVFMTDTPEGLIYSTQSVPGAQGEWKIQKVSEKEYALFPKKWPNRHMCIKNDYIGTMIGCKDAVGPEGRFFIDEI
ncbi:unnamed protein product [Mytilus coruscus]|uniref:Uncharacterized protein n=1 Tax=Mytilus coruscus TaxID=42192 RepID=A0A6J8E9C9_MYTCO|nr:unnamed protein product [Mytilus coruscus]